jgi:hypothetical protein
LPDHEPEYKRYAPGEYPSRTSFYPIRHDTGGGDSDGKNLRPALGAGELFYSLSKKKFLEEVWRGCYTKTQMGCCFRLISAFHASGREDEKMGLIDFF